MNVAERLFKGFPGVNNTFPLDRIKFQEFRCHLGHDGLTHCGGLDPRSLAIGIDAIDDKLDLFGILSYPPVSVVYSCMRQRVGCDLPLLRLFGCPQYLVCYSAFCASIPTYHLTHHR